MSNARLDADPPEHSDIGIFEFAAPFRTAIDPGIVHEAAECLPLAKGIRLKCSIERVADVVHDSFTVDGAAWIRSYIEPEIVIDDVLGQSDAAILRLVEMFCSRTTLEQSEEWFLGIIDGRPNLWRTRDGLAERCKLRIALQQCE